MLTTRLISFFFKKHIKSGLYIDYILRLATKNALLDGLIWGSLYVSEKLLIEYSTRFSVNNYVDSFSKRTTPLKTFALTVQWLIIIIISLVF